MTFGHDFPRLCSVLGAAAMACLTAGGAAAGEASAWDGDAQARVRLIAGAATSDARNAGVEIALGPGWHTYWRYPGDAGVPPHFDFAGSVNVASATVLYPAPRRIVAGGAVSIGYSEHLLFPVRIVPHDPAKPVELALKLDFAVCDKLCVPAQAQARLALPAQAPSESPALASALAQVPQPLALGTAAPDGLAVTAIEHDPKQVVVDVTAPSGEVDLFAEGPDPAWALPVPEKIAGAPSGSQRFRFDLDGLPPGATAKGAELRLTAVSGDRAIEVRTRLD